MYLGIVVILFFLLINVGVNVHAACRRFNRKRPYAPEKNITIGMGTGATLLAASYGGDIFYFPINVSFSLFLAATSLSYLIIAYLIVPRLHYFTSSYSMVEYMGKLYGPSIGRIVDLCGIFTTITLSLIHLKIFSIVNVQFYGIKEHYSFFMAIFFMIFTIGSVGKVIRPLFHLLRCVAFGGLLPLLGWILWEHLVNQSYAEPFYIIAQLKASWYSWLHTGVSPFYCIVFFIFFLLPSFYPLQIASLSSASNAIQVKRSFNNSTFLSLAINVLGLGVAFLLNTAYGHLSLLQFPMNLFKGYEAIKFLFMLVVTALSLFTAGMNLYVAADLILNNLKKPIKERKNILGIILTIAALFYMLRTKDLLTLLWMAHIGFRSVVSVPLLLSVVGIFFHPYAVLIGMLMAFFSLLLIDLFALELLENYALFFPLFSNLLGLMLAQVFFKNYPSFSNFFCLLNCGVFNVIHRIGGKANRFVTYVMRRVMRVSYWNAFWGSPPKNPAAYILFVFYILITGGYSLYTIIFLGNSIKGYYLETIVLFPILLVTMFFFVYLSFPSVLYLGKIMGFLWPISNFYFLYFMPIALVIFSKMSYLYMVILIFNLYFSALIASLGITLFKCGIAYSLIWIIGVCVGNDITWISTLAKMDINPFHAFLMIGMGVAGFAFYKQRVNKFVSIIQELRSAQEEQNARQFFNKHQVEALAYEGGYVVAQLHNQLARSFPLRTYSIDYAIEKQVFKLKKYFEGVFSYLKHNLHVVSSGIDLDQLFQECFTTLKINDIYHFPYLVLDSKQIFVQCDVEKIKKLLIHVLHSCKLYISSGEKGRSDEIYIYVNDAQLGYRLTLLKGKIQKVKAISFTITTSIERPFIFSLYKVIEMADVQLLDKGKGEEEIDREVQHTVNAHYGYYEITRNDNGITYLFVLPVNLHEITKIFASLSPVVYTQAEEIDALSKEEELSFLEKVKKKDHMDLPFIRDVLKLIKTYYAAQKRKTGELFYLHPIAVASILLDITENPDVVIAGLVHDVVHNTPLTEAGLLTIVGESIMQMVLDVDHLERHIPINKNDYPTYLQKVIKEKNRDVICIKLGDTLHNARTIYGHSIEKQKRKARLLQTFYVPLAEQLHFMDIANELNLHAVRILNS